MALEFWKPSCSSCSSGWTCFLEVRKGCTVATIFSGTGTYRTTWWSVTGWLSHTLGNTYTFGNYSLHSNMDSFHIQWKIFHHFITIHAQLKGTMIGPLSYSCSRCSGHVLKKYHRFCLMHLLRHPNLLNPVWNSLLLQPCGQADPYLSGLQKKAAWLPVSPPCWRCFENCRIINLLKIEYITICSISIKSKSAVE